MEKRGEIWLVELDPAVGSEIQKIRPCAVVSPQEINDHVRTVLIAPMTTRGRHASFRLASRFAGKEGLILLDQIRSVDKTIDKKAWSLAACEDERCFGRSAGNI